MLTPTARRSSGPSALTVACVPTGINTGVCTAPWGVVSTPARAAGCRQRPTTVKASGWAPRVCADPGAAWVLAADSTDVFSWPTRRFTKASLAFTFLSLCHGATVVVGARESAQYSTEVRAGLPRLLTPAAQQRNSGGGRQAPRAMRLVWGTRGGAARCHVQLRLSLTMGADVHRTSPRQWPPVVGRGRGAWGLAERSRLVYPSHIIDQVPGTNPGAQAHAAGGNAIWLSTTDQYLGIMATPSYCVGGCPRSGGCGQDSWVSGKVARDRF